MVTAVAFNPDGTSMLTATRSTAQLWPVPAQIRGDPEQVRLWTQVTSGLELDDDGFVRVLGAAAWQQRRQRLQELGGAPEVSMKSPPGETGAEMEPARKIETAPWPGFPAPGPDWIVQKLPHDGSVLRVALSGDGKYAVIGNKTPVLWEVASRSKMQTFQGDIRVWSIPCHSHCWDRG